MPATFFCQNAWPMIWHRSGSGDLNCMIWAIARSSTEKASSWSIFTTTRSETDNFPKNLDEQGRTQSERELPNLRWRPAKKRRAFHWSRFFWQVLSWQSWLWFFSTSHSPNFEELDRLRTLVSPHLFPRKA